MAHLARVSAAVLARDGIDIKAGLLSLLQKKESKFPKKHRYELTPLYWRLVSYAGNQYLLGHKKQQPNERPSKMITVKGCSTDFTPPQEVILSGHNREAFICIQVQREIIFLKAENKHQRDKWISAIRKAFEHHSETSGCSTSSTDTSNSTDLPSHADQKFSHSVRGTSDTEPKVPSHHRRVNTSPAGNVPPSFQRESVTSASSSTNAMIVGMQDKQSMMGQRSVTPRPSLSSSKISQPHSLHDINADSAVYIEVDGNDYDFLPISRTSFSSHHSITNLSELGEGISSLTSKDIHPQSFDHVDGPHGAPQSPPYADVHDEMWHKYTTFIGGDDASSVSLVHNLTNDEKALSDYSDTGPPLPNRNYAKSQRKKKTMRAPQPPINNKDSPLPCKTERKDVHGQQIGSIKHTDVISTDLESNVSSTTTQSQDVNAESIDEYVVRFRCEQFQPGGVIVVLPKIELTPTNIKLSCVGNRICVASLSSDNLQSKLHVDDVIIKVNAQRLPSIKFCYDVFKTTDNDMVELLVERVCHGVMSHVKLPSNGDFMSLGIEFGNECQGNEVTSIVVNGLVAQSGNPPKPQTSSITNEGVPLNWGLIEINQTPVSLCSTPNDVISQITASGCDLALVFVPMDIVQIFKDQCYEEDTEDQYINITST